MTDPQLAEANGLQLAYERFGEPDRPAVLLVMGLASQLVLWPEDLCQALVDAGYQVIRFDNRDIGLSTKLTGQRAPSIPSLVLRRKLGMDVQVPYRLKDMAADAVGLLDALELDTAHVVGASMGGMITQIMAAEWPERVSSAGLLMTTTSHPSLPQPSWRLQRRLMRKRPADTAAAIEQGVQTYRLIGSPGIRQTDDEIRDKITRQVQRNVCSGGVIRQLAAIIASPHRAELVRRISQPTLVLHGADDPLIPVAAARDLTDRIPGARLDIIDGWGHDFPAALVPRVADTLVRHLDAARG